MPEEEPFYEPSTLAKLAAPAAFPSRLALEETSAIHQRRYQPAAD